MPGQFLTDAHRAAYGHFTEEPSPMQLARCFHLDDADLQRLARYRSNHNRLGFALQLGTVRFLGTFVTDLSEAPRTVVRYVGAQVDVADPDACLRHYNNADTQQRHARQIREVYAYHLFSDQPHHLGSREQTDGNHRGGDSRVRAHGSANPTKSRRWPPIRRFVPSRQGLAAP